MFDCVPVLGFSIFIRTKCHVRDQEKREIIQGEDMLFMLQLRPSQVQVRVCVCVCCTENQSSSNWNTSTVSPHSELSFSPTAQEVYGVLKATYPEGAIHPLI